MFKSVYDLFFRLLCTLYTGVSILWGDVVLFCGGSVFGLWSGVWCSLLLWRSRLRWSLCVLRWGYLLRTVELWDTGGLLSVVRVSGDLFGMLLYLFPNLELNQPTEGYQVLIRLYKQTDDRRMLTLLMLCCYAFCIHLVEKMNLLLRTKSDSKACKDVCHFNVNIKA